MNQQSGDSEDDVLRPEIRRFLDALEPRPSKIVVAISGGPDSTALLHALSRLPDPRPALVAAHVNHHLRGDASEHDEAWSREFCSRLGVPIIVLDGRLDPEIVRHQGIESAARAIRYRRLAEERERRGAEHVATAHTRSDQAETVLLRLITGRGTWRLSGILPVTRDRVIRPLLRVPRHEVHRYLSAHGIEARFDESNDDPRFLRNRVRRDLLPLLAGLNPAIEEILADTAALELGRVASLEDLLKPVRRELVSESEESADITIPPDLSPHLLRMLALEQIRRIDATNREVGAAALAAIASLAPGERRTVSSRLHAFRDAEVLRLEATTPDRPVHPFSRPIRPGETVRIPEARWTLSLRDAEAVAELVSANRLRQVIQLHHDAHARFEIRNRRPGDRFRPLGMDRDKNLAEFLIDRRIPLAERDNLPLLLCSERIAWVTGVEVSDEFKVGPGDGRRFEIVAERMGVTNERDHDPL
jgi:tRNA(Ile)-lysidine synthase